MQHLLRDAAAKAPQGPRGCPPPSQGQRLQESISWQERLPAESPATEERRSQSSGFPEECPKLQGHTSYHTVQLVGQAPAQEGSSKAQGMRKPPWEAGGPLPESRPTGSSLNQMETISLQD